MSVRVFKLQTQPLLLHGLVQIPDRKVHILNAQFCSLILISIDGAAVELIPLALRKQAFLINGLGSNLAFFLARQTAHKPKFLGMIAILWAGARLRNHMHPTSLLCGAIFILNVTPLSK